MVLVIVLFEYELYLCCVIVYFIFGILRCFADICVAFVCFGWILYYCLFLVNVCLLMLLGLMR